MIPNFSLLRNEHKTSGKNAHENTRGAVESKTISPETLMAKRNIWDLACHNSTSGDIYKTSEKTGTDMEARKKKPDT